MAYLVLILKENGRLYPFYKDLDPEDPDQNGLTINEETGFWKFESDSSKTEGKIGGVASTRLTQGTVVAGVFPKPEGLSTDALNAFLGHARSASH